MNEPQTSTFSVVLGFWSFERVGHSRRAVLEHVHRAAWSYRVHGSGVELDVMGTVRRFELQRGPESR